MNEDNKKVLLEEITKMEEILGLKTGTMLKIWELEQSVQWEPSQTRNVQDELDDIITDTLEESEYQNFLNQADPFTSEKQEDKTP